ncbi:DNA-directed RNA polymerase subunit beta [Salibacterium halotolerans]|uniref:DNA-directed RNA polymerase subunit beta n=1 Tax=Salibacterium halotolerans TaxID=1884432 RepID=A0A1I5X6P6_9BACI|nr:DNA-directed RNA polymerase subunit beta [Salibacterium halotolerans]SFQ27317.1 DNA-directed RNA polymerase subunit beta [Salibacterium halotolerans]
MTYNEETTQSQSRQERRQEKEQEGKDSTAASKKERRRERIRMVPIWARLLIVLAVFVLSLLAGLVTGYTIVGEGNGLDVLKWGSWERLLEFIRGN